MQVHGDVELGLLQLYRAEANLPSECPGINSFLLFKFA